MGWGKNEIFTVVDRMEAKAFASFLSENCVLRFGNAEEVIGRENIEKAISGFFSTINGLRHHIVNSWTIESWTIIQIGSDVLS